ncbi:MAG TPA: hypothetical protein VEQ37_10605 [Actinomycetota bacterium]|nr:hypothetical protein [Actinomycetota bacterium]
MLSTTHLPPCTTPGNADALGSVRFQAIANRAALELDLNAGRLLRHPRYQHSFQLVTGDLDPEVALKSLRFFFVPVETFPAHRASLPEGHPLSPRYESALTAPFAHSPAHLLFWAVGSRARPHARGMAGHLQIRGGRPSLGKRRRVDGAGLRISRSGADARTRQAASSG